MVVDGAVVMVENIVRHLGREDVTISPMARIREAAHEVQRPVFYAIAIIITAYLPIFTLQRVEGRLFKPMAWTVAFALVGALIFSMLVVPVRSSLLFRGGAREWRNPLMTLLSGRYRIAVRWAIERRGLTVGAGGVGLLAAIDLAFSGVMGSEFLAPPGRRRNLGARHAGAEHRTRRGDPTRQPGASPPGFISGGHDGDQPGGPAR
jgi:cobalt-zinc-cadmium resistance protein CzcA